MLSFSLFHLFSMASKQSPVETRSRKASLNKDAQSFEAMVSLLIRESEERLKQFFLKEFGQRLDRLESHFSHIQSECARMDDEISSIKKVIISQQYLVEDHEKKLREANLILHNVSEDVVSSCSVTLKDDKEKLDYIIRAAKTDVKSNDVVSVRRIGKRRLGGKEKPRPLKISFKDKEQKYKI